MAAGGGAGGRPVAPAPLPSFPRRREPKRGNGATAGAHSCAPLCLCLPLCQVVSRHSRRPFRHPMRPLRHPMRPFRHSRAGGNQEGQRSNRRGAQLCAPVPLPAPFIPPVIPAKAGIQWPAWPVSLRSQASAVVWTPAKAGVTGGEDGPLRIEREGTPSRIEFTRPTRGAHSCAPLRFPPWPNSEFPPARE